MYLGTMAASLFFSQLHQKSAEVTPYLRGYAGDVALQAIMPHTDNQQVIQALYARLEQDNPEAGSAYWLTRTWSLLCWQPTFLAFLCVYTLRSLPPLARMTQYCSDNFISGYQFPDSPVEQGDVESLIASAGAQLRTLLNGYREEMASWVRIRPGFCDHLFGDVVMGCLLRAHQQGQISLQSLPEHTRWWLTACQLPDSFAQTLLKQAESSELSQVRKSCCLVYKCNGRALCGNCPRLPENKSLLANELHG